MLFLWFKCTGIVQEYIFNEFHDLLMQCVNVSNIAITLLKVLNTLCYSYYSWHFQVLCNNLMREYALGDFECIFTYIMYAKDYYPDDNLVKRKS